MKSCPSAPMVVGAHILGIRNEDGSVSKLKSTLPVTENVIEFVSRGSDTPESKARFTAPCIEGQCAQWTSGRCDVIVELLDRNVVEAQPLKRCPIRATCRWFDQSGKSACDICEFVITDMVTNT